MNVKGHLRYSYHSLALVGVGMFIYTLEGVSTQDMVVSVVGVGVGAILPDVDHKNSIAGSIIPLHILSKWFKCFKHGRITHTYIVNIIIIIIAWWLDWWILYGVGFGYYTHLHADNITGNKLPMKWWPLKRKK